MASEGKNLVGVDIGSTSIKIAEIVERRGRRSVVHFGYHPLPPETIVDGAIMNSSAVVEGLEKLFHKRKRRNVALRASGHSVINKTIPMPLMTPAELAEQIEWEATQHIPFELSEVQLDYQVLRQREAEGQMDVLLVAAKKDEINDLTGIAMEARLKPVVVDLDAFAVQNVYELGYGMPEGNQVVALVHVGGSLTTVNVVADGSTAFVRDVASGGARITEEIQRSMSVSIDEAESFKIGGDGTGIVPEQVPALVQSAVESLVGQIQRSLDFYLATSGEHLLSKIYVSGGTAHIAGLAEVLSNRLRVDVEVLDPLRAAPPDMKGTLLELEGRGPQAAVAFGLALRKEKERR